jgi:hypothetical protein
VLVGQRPGESISRAVELLLRAQLHLELQEGYSSTGDPHLLRPCRAWRETEARADRRAPSHTALGIPDAEAGGERRGRGAKAIVVGAADHDRPDSIVTRPSPGRRALAAKLDDRSRCVPSSGRSIAMVQPSRAATPDAAATTAGEEIAENEAGTEAMSRRRCGLRRGSLRKRFEPSGSRRGRSYHPAEEKRESEVS